MKLFKQIIFILIVFFQTGNVLSDKNLFNVNNIKLEKKGNISNKDLADKAIKTAFTQLTAKILLNEDNKKLSNLDFSSIKKLVTYYQISDIQDENKNKEFVNFSITFDKEKIHNLFYQRGVSYSEILEKELYVLPILIKNDEVFIFNKNNYYNNWNKLDEDGLLEFILPLENIEIIQNINVNKSNLVDLKIDNLFKEYAKKNTALILIEENNNNVVKIYIKSQIQEKRISKSLKLKKNKSNNIDLIIDKIKKELINLVKSENLIDIRTPSFLNVKLNLNSKSNLVELNLRVKNIDLIENIFVQEFNKDYMNLRIKYLGKLDKILSQLRNENISLEMINDQWIIKTL